MKYCLKCGRKIKVDRCPECGMKKNIIAAEKEDPVDSSALLKKRYEKKKRRRVMTLATLFLIILGGTAGWYSWESSQATPTKVIEEFKQAVNERNSGKVINLIEAGNPKFSPTKEDIDNYLTYASENKKLFMARLEQLHQTMNHEEAVSPIDKQSNNWFAIKEGKKKWGLFRQYLLVVTPFYVQVDSNMEDATIFLNGEKVGKINDAEPVTIGPILPGIYEAEATYNGEYSSFSQTKQLDFSKEKGNKLTIGLALDGAFVSIHTSPEAKIFVNGKDSGINPARAGNSGPFALDGSVTLHAELTTPDGIMKSKEYILTNTKDLYLDIDYIAPRVIEKENPVVKSEDEETVAETLNDSINEQKLAAFIYNVSYSSVEAINNHDISYVSGLFDEKGPGYAETKEYIEYVNNKGITEELLSNEIESYHVIDEDTLELTTNEEYKIFYGDGTEKRKAFVSKYLIRYNVNDFQVIEMISTEEVE